MVWPILNSFFPKQFGEGVWDIIFSEEILGWERDSVGFFGVLSN